MLESVTCPSCLARYGLRPERVHAGIRRARCFRCGDTFGIEEVVKRIFPATVPVPDTSVAIAEASPLAELGEPRLTLDGIHPEDLMELGHPEPQKVDVEAEHALTSFADLDDSGLVLGDLEDSLLEAPAPAAPSAPEVPGTYASAKDAIHKLLGSSMVEPPQEPRPIPRQGGAVDVDAALDALENTLGGVNPKELTSAPPPPPAPSEPPSSLGTVKLSTQEIQAAMFAAHDAPTPREIPAPPPPPQPVVPPPPPQSAGGPEDVLKVKIGTEIHQNLTQDQLVVWIEQGRVLDWHMVARQHSEHWIEAGKIPSLRATFERMKRQQEGIKTTEAPPPVMEAAPAKRSIFSGLFGRG